MVRESLEELNKAYWYSFSDEPIATTSKIRQRLSDPSFLTPEEAPDSLWHLFAHTYIGLEHYTSNSGLEWKREKMIFARSHSPYIYIENGTYYLLFESHSSLPLKKEERPVNSSRILISSSKDLYSWSSPELILDSINFHRSVYRASKPRISRPNLVFYNGEYNLYFGSGETRLFDTKQKVTAYFMRATSSSLLGPYKVNSQPLLRVEPDSLYRNLSPGSVRVIQCKDGLAGFEAAYFFDKEKSKSSSALLLLESKDGATFKEKKLILKSADYGWASRYISSVDVRYKEGEDSYYLYYSANNEKKIFPFRIVTEALGLLLGSK